MKREYSELVATRGMPLRVALEPIAEIGDSGIPGANVSETGTFQIKAGAPGHYDIEVSNLAPDLYLKSIRFGGAEILERGLEIGQGSTAEITVVLGAGSGALEGSLESSARAGRCETRVLAARQGRGAAHAKNSKAGYERTVHYAGLGAGRISCVRD